MDAPSAYNILLGRTFLNAIRVIPSAYHMVIKFPTANGVGMVRGDQRVARECYSASMKQKAVGSIYMDELDMRDELEHPTYALRRTRTDTTRRPVRTSRLHQIQIGQRCQGPPHPLLKTKHRSIRLEAGGYGGN